MALRLCVGFYPSPLGSITLASEGERLVGLWFAGQRHYGAGYDLGSAALCPTAPLRAAAAWLDAYFAGQRPPLHTLPLAPAGSAFRQAVWQLLRGIPYGRTTSYGALAAELRARGVAASAQAVGGAVARNPISIIIPCHRVVAVAPAAAGSYAAGPHIKAALLKHEGINDRQSQMPVRAGLPLAQNLLRGPGRRAHPAARGSAC